MRIIYCLFVLLIHFSFVQAQNVQLYEDAFGLKGEVLTTDFFEFGKLPEKGKLDIRWRSFNDGKLKTYRIKGFTKNAQLEGLASWEVARWQYEVNAGETIKPVFAASGKRKKWEGAFLEGKPNGKWTFVLDSLASDGKVFAHLLRLEMNFKKGIPDGAFYLENNLEQNGLKITGACNKSGIVNGAWTFLYKDASGKTVKEIRIYKEGLLTEIRKTEEVGVSSIMFDHNIDFIENKVDTAYVKLGSQLFEMDEMPTIESEVLHRSLDEYFLSGWKLPVFGGEVHFEIPRYRQLAFLLTEKEKKEIADIERQIQAIKQSIQTRMQGNTFIQRHKSAKLDTTIAYLTLVENRINQLDSLLKITETEAFTYQNRNQALWLSWKDYFSEKKTAQGEVFTDLTVIQNEVFFAENQSFLEGVLAHLEEEDKRIHFCFEDVEKETTIIQQEGELEQMAHLIEEKYKSIEQIYSKKFGVAQDIQEQLIEGEAVRLIQAFSTATQYKNAQKVGNELLQLFDSLETWEAKLNLFDAMESNLRTQYRYLAYNPYTGENDIEIRVKKRFLGIVLTELWPFLNQELKATNKWQDWSKVWGHYFDVYAYLMNFAKREDAQALRVEKRIRKEKKAEKILRIILHQIEDEAIDKAIGKN